MKRTIPTFIMLAALSALVFAGCYRTPEQRAAHFVDRISEELKLNDAQKVHLDKIKDEFLAKRLEMTKDRDEVYDVAIGLMKSDMIDRAKLDALTEKSQGRTGDAVKFFFAKFAEFHDMLTPEQRTKVTEHLKEHREKHRR